MTKEEKIGKSISDIASGVDGVEWASNEVFHSICSDVRILTNKGFHFTFRVRDGIIDDLLVAKTPSGKEWSTQDPLNYKKKNPSSFVSEKDKTVITRRINQLKLGFKITIAKRYIVEVNGSEVKPFIFDKGMINGIAFPRDELGSNKFSDRGSAVLAAKAFKRYYTAFQKK